jgi:hypothetical protein
VCHTPQRQELPGIDENTVEAPNRPLPTDHLKSGPTGLVNPFDDVKVISSSLPDCLTVYKRPPTLQVEDTTITQEHSPLSLSELVERSAQPHCNTAHLQYQKC